MRDITKVSKVSKVSQVSQVAKVARVSKVANVAFKPFENSIYDLRGLIRLLDGLTLTERSLFRGNEGTIAQKARDFTDGSVTLLFEEVEKAGLEPVGDAKQLAFLKELTAYLKGLSVVRIRLAFAPTNTFVQRISDEISSVCQAKTLVDLVVDEYIVGGAVFEMGGRVFEQTLDSELNRVLEKQIQGFGT